MEISELELFDVSGNGMLVLKTNVDEPGEDLCYTWYVTGNGICYKGEYQKKPYTAIQLPGWGKYAVKAFVRNGEGEKVSVEKVFRADRKTSPSMADMDKNLLAIDAPAVEHISGGFWRFRAVGEMPKGARFAWYVYREGQEEPLVRSVYAEEPTYVHKFETAGNYSAKLFVMTKNTKSSAVTESFAVEV